MMYCDYKYNTIEEDTEVRVNAMVYEGNYFEGEYIRSGILDQDVDRTFVKGTSMEDIDKDYNAILKTYPDHTPIPEQT